MTTEHLMLIAADIVAALILTFGLYFPRHRRRDLVVAFLGVNIGVLAVTSVLGSSEIAAGLGLGSSGCCRSSACAPRRSRNAKWPTTSPRSRWGSSGVWRRRARRCRSF